MEELKENQQKVHTRRIYPVLKVSSMFILLVKWNPMSTLSPRYFGEVNILIRLNTIQDTAHRY